MERFVLALVASVGLVAVATATTVAPRQEPPAFWKKFPAELVSRVLPSEEKQEFRMTDQTEIKLDGRVCPYDRVPGDATIILLEVASDQVILKIHFQSKK